MSHFTNYQRPDPIFHTYDRYAEARASLDPRSYAGRITKLEKASPANAAHRLANSDLIRRVKELEGAVESLLSTIEAERTEQRGFDRSHHNRITAPYGGTVTGRLTRPATTGTICSLEAALAGAQKFADTFDPLVPGPTIEPTEAAIGVLEEVRNRILNSISHPSTGCRSPKTLHSWRRRISDAIATLKE